MGSDMRHSTVLVAKRGSLTWIVGKTKTIHKIGLW